MAEIRHIPAIDSSNNSDGILPSLAICQTDSDNDDRLIGSMFEGKYQIEKRLYQDSLGVIYRATHIFMEHSVAIKLLSCDRVIDSSLIDAFKREALSASRLDHENIISILDFGLTSNTLYLVMEYLDGQLLRERLDQGLRYHNEEVMTILLQLCSALELAHKNGLIHQHLSPDNIYLHKKEKQEIVKVLDFGIAKLPLTNFSLKNGLGTERLLRAPQYLSPEQCQGIAPTHLNDIYSLGLIAFEMLTGQLPFQATNWSELADKKLKEEPPKPSELNAKVSPVLDALVLRMLAKNPQERPRSAQQLADEIQEALGNNKKKTGSLMMAACSNPDCKQLEPSNAGRCTSCQALLIGTMVRQRYEIRKMVGRGGFGSTYLVVDHDCFNEIRILKELLSKRANSNGIEEVISETAKRLFKREAQVLLNLQHPGIPKLYAYFIDEGCPYLVQDFIPGTTLTEELSKRDRRFDEQEACTILSELADILEYLHTRPTPVIHRDLKPQNIMRRIDGRLLIIDFGAVCRAANYRLDSPTLIGSPGYSPLEQIYGQPVPQSDLYAAGATIVCLLTGISPSELFDEQRQRLEWESLVKVSPQFAALLNDLLNPFIKKRLSSASELKRRLQEINTEPIKVSAQLINTATCEIPSVKPGQTGTGKLVQSTVTAEIKTTESGALSQKPIPFLLQQLRASKFNGTLTCFNDNEVKTIKFLNGQLLLLNEREAEFYQKTFPLFQWIDGTYQIKPEELLLKTDRSEKPITLETADLILSGIRSVTSPEVLKQWLGDIRQELSANSLDCLDQSIRLMPSEVFIASRIEHKTTIEELLSMSNFSEVDLLRAICILLAIGLIERTNTDHLSPASAACFSAPGKLEQRRTEQRVEPPAGNPNNSPVNNIEKYLEKTVEQDIEKFIEKSQPVQNEKTSKQNLPRGLDYQSAATFCYEIESLFNCIELESHYAVLGVAPTASEVEIRAAYAQLAKRFHTDRAAQLADYHAELRDKLAVITRRLTEAVRVLSDSSLRREYDHKLRSGLKRQLLDYEEKPTNPRNKISINSRFKTQPLVEEKQPVVNQQEYQRYCQQLRSKLFLIAQRADFYQLLEVTRDANRFQIEESFKRLCRQYNPQRHEEFAENGFNLKPQLVSISAALYQAKHVLLDPIQRRRYDEKLQPLQTQVKNESEMRYLPSPINANGVERRSPERLAVEKQLAETVPSPPQPEPLKVEIDAKGKGSWVNPQSADIIYRSLSESNTPAKISKELTDSDYYERSLLMYARGDYKQAISAIYRAINLAPKQARYWQQLGDIYHSLPDGQKRAKQAYLQAERLSR